MSGIYVHIPYCRKACHYCDFHFSTNLQTKDHLLNALLKELEMRHEYISKRELDTIYFGGGTPSILTGQELARIISGVKQFYDVNNPEVTLEANPDDLTEQKLEEIADVGINRLSIGIQSFNDDFLKLFNRSHDAAMAIRVVKNARQMGFKNISTDLIYGIPSQSLAAFDRDLMGMLALDTEHISIYGLTFEPNTVFSKWLEQDRIQLPDEETVAQQFEHIINTLSASGYLQYEVSNFCKPGFESRHNSSYWAQKEYLGIGPGAHSYNGTSRQYNVSNNNIYIKKIEAGTVPAQIEMLTTNQMINEVLLTSIRTSQGIDLTGLQQRFGMDLLKEKQSYIRQFQDQELLEHMDNHLRLTRKGLLLADSITEGLMIE